MARTMILVARTARAEDIRSELSRILSNTEET